VDSDKEIVQKFSKSNYKWVEARMHLGKGKREEYGRNEEDVPERTNFRFLKGS
jgi:hypothetical protein